MFGPLICMALVKQATWCTMQWSTLFTNPEQVCMTSKTRVVPLKPLTIPRLELTSARILATIVDKVRSVLNDSEDQKKADQRDKKLKKPLKARTS